MNVLRLSYTSLAEPLGESQVLAYLRGLSGAHRISLVTSEKPADLAYAAAMARLRARCGEHSIRWIARRYHHRPRLASIACDLAGFTWPALRQARECRADLVHARNYIPAFVALVLKRTLGTAFISYMRAFWPEHKHFQGNAG